jgi:hypothetical protein
VITNDSDLKEPIAVAERELGMVVGVVNPHLASRRSRAIQATFFKHLRPSTLPNCQFPSALRDAFGVIETRDVVALKRRDPLEGGPRT